MPDNKNVKNKSKQICYGKNRINPDLLYRDLTYKINGILMRVHRELGSYAREKQYADLIEKIFIENKIKYQRELRIGNSGNVIDFLIEGVVVLELKTVPFLSDDHYSQVKRYLHQTTLKLGIITNFRCIRLVIRRVLNPDSP